MATIQVPHALYHRLERLAALTAQPLERLIEQALAAGLPILPDDLPPTWREALLALEGFDNTALEQEALATMPAERYEAFAALRTEAKVGGLSAADATQLEQLTAEADLLPLRKAYAAVLLKWRGCHVPAWIAAECYPSAS